MPESAEDRKLEQQKTGAIAVFLAALVPSARMMSLYKPGHPAIIPITQRVTALLVTALGQETTLVVDFKGKAVVVHEAPLPETKDINQLAATLHTLGVGQLLFTNRLVKEGMYEFLKVLLLKADAKRSLSVIQQDLQKLKIPGMQLFFADSVMDVGEINVSDQQPGRLSEAQVAAFAQAETLQDLLLLLLAQNETLTGKKAEALTAALDNTLNREMSLEQFQAAMLWDHYDPRIRACWDRLLLQRSAACGGKRPARAGRSAVISGVGLFGDADLAALRARNIQAKPEALRLALETVHGVLQKPSIQAQAKIALLAYGRVLSELGKDGDLPGLFSEFKKWQEPKPFSEFVMKLMAAEVVSPPLAKNLVARLSAEEEKSAGFKDIEDLMASLGVKGLPHFLDELRELAEVNSRRKLCLLLTRVCKRLRSIQPLLPALSDPDWFLTRNVVMILGDVNLPGTASLLVPLLKHHHQRVREETIRSLVKTRDAAALAALASFITDSDNHEEAFVAITALSLLAQQGTDEKLIRAFQAVDDYETRVAIVTALSRVATPAVQAFLAAQAGRSLLELLTGRNKALRAAARDSLRQVKGVLKK